MSHLNNLLPILLSGILIFMHNRKELYTLVTISNVDMGSLHTKQNSKLCPMNSWQSFIFYCCLNSWNHCSTLFTFAIFNVVRHILNSKTVCLAIYKVDVKWVMNKSTYGLILYLFFAYLYFWINNRVRVKVKIHLTKTMIVRECVTSQTHADI